MLRAAQCFKTLPGKHLSVCAADDVAVCLDVIVRKDGLIDWPFGRAVDAMQNFFATSGAGRLCSM